MFRKVSIEILMLAVLTFPSVADHDTGHHIEKEIRGFYGHNLKPLILEWSTHVLLEFITIITRGTGNSKYRHYTSKLETIQRQ